MDAYGLAVEGSLLSKADNGNAPTFTEGYVYFDDLIGQVLHVAHPGIQCLLGKLGVPTSKLRPQLVRFVK